MQLTGRRRPRRSSTSGLDLAGLMETLPIAAYCCDGEGRISGFNGIAVALWGRTPEVGNPSELYCGSAKLWFPDGKPLPHDQSPMAVALREGCQTRNRSVVVERPDGTRILALVSVAPIRDDHGRVSSAVGVFQETRDRNRGKNPLFGLDVSFRQMLDALPAAVYTTDAEGRLTYFNPAAVELSGRVPQIGDDEWCVSWKLYYPDGRPMPRDECPMALTLKSGRAVRGQQAIAERPDGSRVWFEPYPTPLRDENGRLVGGMNMLLDLGERKQAEGARAKLAAIVESSDDAIIAKDLDGVITSWNQGAERLFGYSATEAIGCSVTMLIPENRLDEEPGILARIRRGERIEHYETVRRRKDGKLVDVSLSVSPLRDAYGKIAGAAKIGRDITERKISQEVLRQSEERFRTLVSLIAEVPWNTDAEGRFVAPQPAWSAYTGQDWESSREFGWADAVHVEDRENLLATWRKACEAHSAYRSHGRLWHASTRRYRHFEARATPLLHADGTVREWVGACTDVEEQRAIEQTLKHADERKNEFLAVLAHELRNPLAPIRYSASIIKKCGDNAQKRSHANEVIERQTEHMARLLDDLLDVSRITRGAMELRWSRIELASVVATAVDAVRYAIDAKRHALNVDLPEEPVHFVADSARVSQILTNLLTNAAKYTDSGGRIELRAAIEGDEVVLYVRDSGIGIAPAMLARLFDMFAQDQSVLERSEGGLGIGLALVKGLVGLHGGTIAAHSEGRNRGSEFVVRLPVAVAVESEVKPTECIHPAGTSAKQRILVADDNRESAETCAMLLEFWGHEVEVVDSGTQAFEVAQRWRPRVLLLDIGMPGLSGYELARKIRATDWGQHVFLVAVTGWGQEGDRSQAMAAGFDRHLTKPVDPETLQLLLERLPEEREVDPYQERVSSREVIAG